jgi:hypothetical protein
VMPRPALLRLSSRTGEGVADWLAWLEARRAARPAAERAAPRAQGHPA